MRTLTRAFYCGFAALAVSAGAASAQSLGASVSSIKRLYPEAASTRVGTNTALEMKDLDYAGVRWGQVDFIFDATGHLSRLSMDTSATSYDAVLQLAQLQLNPTTAVAGLARAADDASPEMEIRVCESGDGKVTMTFEPVSTVS